MLKLIAFVALFAGFCWFGTQVTLGSHTLFGHLHAIAGTRESQDLFDGTRESAKPLVDDVRRRIAGAPTGTTTGTPTANPAAPKAGEADHAAQASASARPDAGPPQERLTNAERRHLRRLISSAESASARP